MEEQSKEEKDIFILQNKIIFKKYRPIQQIGKGTFSNVYLALNTKNNTYVAIKAEKRDQKGVELLEDEAFLLYSLRGFGIPTVLSYGKTKAYNILVLPLLGKSLLDLFIIKNKNIHINDICLIAIQILERIEWIHSNNIVYRDIKPENFLFGKKDPEVLYLIDFGLCRKYKSSNTGKHIKPKNMGKFTGTSRYASVYAMAGNEQSRRDDIESIGYMIIFLMRKRLPWQGIKGNSYKECYHKLFSMKKNIPIEELCKGLPREIIEYMNNAKSLKFEEEPNYNYLKNLFYMILKKNKFNMDNKIFSWLVKMNNNKNNINNKNLEKSNSVGKTSGWKLIRKSSPQNRLYNQIKKSIEKKKSGDSRKISPRSERTDYASYNTDQNKFNLQRANEDIINKSKEYLSYNIKKDENSEISNTMKVMVNKNINSRYNENVGNLPKVNSENNIYHDNFFAFNINDEHKNKKNKKYSPQNERFNKNYYAKREKLPKIKISDDENSNNFIYNTNENNNNNKIELKKIILQNRNNKINSPGNLLKITPLKNISNLNTEEGQGYNNYYKIKQIKIVNTNNNLENINNYNSLYNKQNSNDNHNITYNTYNTYNTFNSFNDTLDKTRTNNNNYNNNPHNIIIDSNQIINKRINHLIYQKNNANNKNFKSNKKNNNDSGLIEKKFIDKRHPNKIIHLDRIEAKREINSVNFRKKPLNSNDNIFLKNNQNKMNRYINKRANYSPNRIGNNCFKWSLSPKGGIKKNNGRIMNLIKNNNLIGMKNPNKLSNNRFIVLKEKLRTSNSCNNINRNNNMIKKNMNNYIRFKDLNKLCFINQNLNQKKKVNVSNIDLKNKNQNNLKRIFIINNKNNSGNNTFIRLDKKKNNNNLNPLKNEVNTYNINSKKSSPNRSISEAFSNNNNFKNNTLKRISNNNLCTKNPFISFKYKREDDSNSLLIHNYKNLKNSNNLINENSSINISSNKRNYNFENNKTIKDCIFHGGKTNEEKQIFDEFDHKFISKKMKKKNIIINKTDNFSEGIFGETNNIEEDNNYLKNKFRTEDIEIKYSGGCNNNEINSSNRINKYKMIRYKET